MRLLFSIGILMGSLAIGACSNDNASPAVNATIAASSTDANGQPGDGRGAAAIRATPAAAAGITYRDITIPAGTMLPVILDTDVASDASRVEQPVEAHLSHAVIVNGVTALDEGSLVKGTVTDAVQAGKVKGRAHVAMRFDTLVPRGEHESHEIRTAAVVRTAAATKKDDALKIGLPAAGGAIVGGIIGGKKGALVGTAAGGGAGTAVVLSTRGKEVRYERGSALSLRLIEPLTIRIRESD
jgi:hypothetical protein